VRRDAGPVAEDIGDDEVLLKLLKTRIATATGYFEVLDFCKMEGNEGTREEIEFLAARGREHWDRARGLIRERRELDRARKSPPRVVEAVAGK